MPSSHESSSTVSLQRRQELGRFLRAARARVRPDRADADAQGDGERRRTGGLRQDEIAARAGISRTYYARLEQGRLDRVSPQVLGALARALDLDQAEQTFLSRILLDTTLASQDDPGGLRSSVRSLVADSRPSPAFVLGRGMRFLTLNTLACRLMFDVDELPARTDNLAVWTFRAPAARRLYLDWDAVAADVAAILRMDLATETPPDRAAADVVAELRSTSADFRHIWARGEVSECSHGTKRFAHPRVGEMELHYEAFGVPARVDQKLIVYRAEPGSISEDRLTALEERASR
ncbi:helix-turn-helix transcriptional regulator [Nocardioides fonticola]|uniref:Helix-turn-helix transcriptional regulator n=1 Tax=Nocardioides fonticola TaxID=450363 RepID=A0ABP7XKJ9_9ACTN